MLVLGALTIVPTCLLAREISLSAGASRGRATLAGSIAAGLLAVNAAHVIVISHVAWGNCATPLFTTTAGWLLARAARLDGSGSGLGRSGGLLLVLACVAFGLALGGLLNDRDTPLPPIWHPAVVAALGMAVLAMLWLLRRRELLIPLVVLSGLALLPLVNGKYAPLVSNTRYLMPLTIVLLASIAAWATKDPLPSPPPARGREPGPAAGEPSPSPSQGEGLGRGYLLPLAAVLLLLVGSADSLATFSRQAHRDGRTNVHLLASLSALEAAYQPGDIVSVARAMYRDWTLTEGRLQRVFESWLDVRGIPYPGGGRGGRRPTAD